MIRNKMHGKRYILKNNSGMYIIYLSYALIKIALAVEVC